MPEKITIVKESGESITSNIMSIFMVPDNNKQYIITTENAVDPHGLTVLHVSEIKGDKIIKVQTDDEWATIKTIMRSIISGSVSSFKYIPTINNINAPDQYSRDISVSAGAAKTLLESYTNSKKEVAIVDDTTPEIDPNAIASDSIFPTAPVATDQDNEIVPGIAEVDAPVNIEPAIEQPNLSVGDTEPKDTQSSGSESAPVIPIVNEIVASGEEAPAISPVEECVPVDLYVTPTPDSAPAEPNAEEQQVEETTEAVTEVPPAPEIEGTEEVTPEAAEETVEEIVPEETTEEEPPADTGTTIEIPTIEIPTEEDNTEENNEEGSEEGTEGGASLVPTENATEEPPTPDIPTPEVAPIPIAQEIPSIPEIDPVDIPTETESVTPPEDVNPDEISPEVSTTENVEIPEIENTEEINTTEAPETASEIVPEETPVPEVQISEPPAEATQPVESQATTTTVDPEAVRDMLNEIINNKIEEVMNGKIETIVPQTIEGIIPSTIQGIVPSTIESSLPKAVEETLPGIQESIEKKVEESVNKAVEEKVEGPIKQAVENTVSNTIEKQSRALNSLGIKLDFGVESSFGKNASLDEIVAGAQELFVEGVKNLIMVMTERIYKELRIKEEELKKREVIVEQREQAVNDKTIAMMNGTYKPENYVTPSVIPQTAPIAQTVPVVEPAPVAQTAPAVEPAPVAPTVAEPVVPATTEPVENAVAPEAESSSPALAVAEAVPATTTITQEAPAVPVVPVQAEVPTANDNQVTQDVPVIQVAPEIPVTPITSETQETSTPPANNTNQ